MEVVLANGDILRTGMGSMPNSNTWQVFKWGYGPSLDGIFTQSNFGIVTKLGIWLMPAPPAYKPFVVRYPDQADIVKAIETVRPLRIAQIIPNAGTVSNALWELAVVNRRADLYTGEGAIPDASVAKLAKAHGVGSWNVYTALYGTEEVIAEHWKIVTAAFKASGGTVLTQEDLGPDDPLFNYRRDVMRGDLTMREFGLYNWRGGGGSMWFAPVSQARGSETLKQMGLAKRILNKYGIDYVGLFVIGWRDMHHIIDILYDRTLPAELEKARNCYSELLDDFAREGYGVYRTNIDFMDKVAKLYGPVKASVNRKIKKALDPNGILAPGKSGIYR
jgi:4-cresol dehydrogenase (hydroxylating)